MIPRARGKFKHFVVVGLFILLGLSLFGIASQIQSEKIGVISVPTPTFSPTPTPAPGIKAKVTVISSPTPISTPNSTPSAPATSDQPAANSQTNTPAVYDTVNLNLDEPDGNFSFSLNYHEGMNPCSMLNDAKNEGKIRSLNIVHYDSLNSDYVREMNSYQEGWTFSINGDSKPTGCSNYTLSKGDTVNWKYN